MAKRKKRPTTHFTSCSLLLKLDVMTQPMPNTVEVYHDGRWFEIVFCQPDGKKYIAAGYTPEDFAARWQIDGPTLDRLRAFDVQEKARLAALIASETTPQPGGGA